MDPRVAVVQRLELATERLELGELVRRRRRCWPAPLAPAVLEDLEAQRVELGGGQGASGISSSRRVARSRSRTLLARSWL